MVSNAKHFFTFLFICLQEMSIQGLFSFLNWVVFLLFMYFDSNPLLDVWLAHIFS
jgi:hypothetical protein